MSSTQNLKGKLLIAMPGMGDPRFDKSVVYLCEHSEKGSMGLIINKPSDEVSFDELLQQLEIPRGDRSRDIRVFFGGPVELGRGFVLHSTEYPAGQSTLVVDARFGMTATLDILEDIARGEGPERALFALGYSGWGPGQLEHEILENGWLTCDAAPDLVFDADPGAIWARALHTLGVNPLLLSASAGRA